MAAAAVIPFLLGANASRFYCVGYLYRCLSLCIDPTPFFRSTHYTPELYDPCKRVKKFAKLYVRSINQHQTFDWQAFKEAIDHHPGTAIVVDMSDTTTVHQSNNTESTMADKITDYVMAVFCPLANKRDLKQDIERVMSAHKSKMPGGPAHSAQEGPPSSSLGVIAALPSPIGTTFNAVLATINFTQELTMKQPRWHRQVPVQTEHFVAHVTGIRLIVDKSFQPPGPPRSISHPPPDYASSKLEYLLPQGKNNTSPQEHFTPRDVYCPSCANHTHQDATPAFSSLPYMDLDAPHPPPKDAPVIRRDAPPTSNQGALGMQSNSSVLNYSITGTTHNTTPLKHEPPTINHGTLVKSALNVMPSNTPAGFGATQHTPSAPPVKPSTLPCTPSVGRMQVALSAVSSAVRPVISAVYALPISSKGQTDDIVYVNTERKSTTTQEQRQVQSLNTVRDCHCVALRGKF
ncbi:unnamed protein product [Rhizoctonia solani]|uniref:Uncharacterized protein n=1 Tax=Rhizoctonia solani TaxID=456999 RepID=A0A8H3AW82_9AGAM|nr:unnamed protein product [Rhizoctonia solani]